MKLSVRITHDPYVYGQVVDKWWDLFRVNVFDYDNIPLSVTSIPAVGQMVALHNDKPIQVTKQVADWWYKLTQEVSPKNYPHDEIVKTLLNLTQGRKAFTNNTGWDEKGGDRREYWSDRKGGSQKEDMGLQYVYSAGSTYRILRELTLYGRPCYAIAAFDAFDPSTYTKTYKGNEFMFTIATSNSRDPNIKPEGFRVNPFPRLYDRSIDNYSRVLVPLLANHRTELYIEKKYIKILPAGSTIPAYPYRNP